MPFRSCQQRQARPRFGGKGCRSSGGLPDPARSGRRSSVGSRRPPPQPSTRSASTGLSRSLCSLGPPRSGRLSQNGDGPVQVEPLIVREWRCRARRDAEIPLLRGERFTQHRQSRCVRQLQARRCVKGDIAASIDRDAESLLMHRTMMASAEQDEIVETRRAAIRPVLHVMCVAEPQAAAGESAAAVALLECPTDCRRDRSCA